MMYETVDAVAWMGLGATAAHLVIIIVIGVRVLMRRRAPGSSAAWLLLVITLPYLGAVLYLMIGERRLGGRRAERAMMISEPVRRWIGTLPERAGDDHEPVIERWIPVRHLADAAVGISALPGNQLELLADAERILRAIISDIERAAQFCLLEFYIWNPGGTADDVAEALLRAATRGVRCQVLVDAVGGKDFFRSSWPKRMRDANVEVRAALPAGVIRTLFRRIDLRLHRKLVVVDGNVAYTGSLNLVDPRYFKQDAGVGQWVDAMARIEGPVVEALAGLFAWDWALETGAPLERLIDEVDVPLDTTAGRASVQMVPSGPGYEGSAVVQLLLSAIYGAREELILTTPYFVPDEPLVAALRSAAQRGVRVRLIVPVQVDSFLVRYASRAFFTDLLEAGVEILLFNGGLLHTKSVVVDRELALFGTLNLDIRSFLLNFEVTLIVYDPGFARDLATLQMSYAGMSEPLALADWERRPEFKRLTENLLQILSPLL